MNHRHRKVLHALFAHPVSSNIDPKAVHAVFDQLGAELSHNGSGRIAVTLNGHAHAFHDSRHSLSKDEVVEIRHFLTQAGVDPSAYPDGHRRAGLIFWRIPAVTSPATPRPVPRRRERKSPP